MLFWNKAQNEKQYAVDKWPGRVWEIWHVWSLQPKNPCLWSLRWNPLKLHVIPAGHWSFYLDTAVMCTCSICKTVCIVSPFRTYFHHILKWLQHIIQWALQPRNTPLRDSLISVFCHLPLFFSEWLDFYIYFVAPRGESLPHDPLLIIQTAYEIISIFYYIKGFL